MTAAAAEKDHVVVVYNTQLDGSEEIAGYYAKKRGLSDDQLIGISCTPNESISRRDFAEFIQKPLIDKLEESGWWKIRRDGGDWRVTQSRLKYLVLCHGIPLKIEEQPPEQMDHPPPAGTRTELTVNRAAVDTELALLPSPKAPITGALPNPFYGKNNIDDLSDWNLKAVLVTRLDGPNPAACKRLVDGAITGEEHGIWGRAVVDMRGLKDGAYLQGDQWLAKLVDLLKSSGWDPYVDRAEPTIDDPAPFQSTALYGGWYSDSICGPMADRNFQFVPGAVAYHIHSFSAESVRTFDQKWVGPLVARGAAATMGCVNEPYLQFTPTPDLFFKHLLYGKNFAEAAYLSQPVLSWQITMAGDPLYRPFRQRFDQALAQLEKENSSDLPWAYLRKSGQMASAGMIDPAIQLLEARFRENPHVLYAERLARLYAEKKDFSASIRLWKQCIEKSAGQPPLKAHSLLSLARTEWDAGMAADSIAHYRQYVDQFADHPSRKTVAVEAGDRAVQKGMRADADHFNRIAAPPPPDPAK